MGASMLDQRQRWGLGGDFSEDVEVLGDLLWALRGEGKGCCVH